MNKPLLIILGTIAFCLIPASQTFFTVDQREQAIVLFLGQPIGEIKGPGLHIKMPVLQEVKTFDTVGKGKAYKLSDNSKKRLREVLLTQSEKLRDIIKKYDESTLVKAIGFNAGEYGLATFAVMSKNTDLDKKILKKTFDKVNNDLNHYECEVEKCQWVKVNETDIKLNIKSNRFVYSMVRSLVGTMVDIGSGKLDEHYLKIALDKKDRNLCSRIAPANGLFFEKAYFNSNYRILN